MSERRACRVLGADRTSVRYRATRPGDSALRDRLKALAQERRRSATCREARACPVIGRRRRPMIDWAPPQPPRTP